MRSTISQLRFSNTPPYTIPSTRCDESSTGAAAFNIMPDDSSVAARARAFGVSINWKCACSASAGDSRRRFSAETRQAAATGSARSITARTSSSCDWSSPTTLPEVARSTTRPFRSVTPSTSSFSRSRVRTSASHAGRVSPDSNEFSSSTRSAVKRTTSFTAASLFR